MAHQLADAEARRQQNPESFEIPELAIRESLSVGQWAKDVFEQDGRGERMWIRITQRTENGYVGELNNKPTIVTGLKMGDIVEFEARHIIDFRR